MSYVDSDILLKRIIKEFGQEDISLYKTPDKDLPEDGEHIYICYLSDHYKHYSEGYYKNNKFIIRDFRLVSGDGFGIENAKHEYYDKDITNSVLAWFSIPEYNTDEYNLRAHKEIEITELLPPDKFLQARDNVQKLTDYYLFIQDYIRLSNKYKEGYLTESRYRLEIKRISDLYKIYI